MAMGAGRHIKRDLFSLLFCNRMVTQLENVFQEEIIRLRCKSNKTDKPRVTPESRRAGVGWGWEGQFQVPSLSGLRESIPLQLGMTVASFGEQILCRQQIFCRCKSTGQLWFRRGGGTCVKVLMKWTWPFGTSALSCEEKVPRWLTYGKCQLASGYD